MYIAFFKKHFCLSLIAHGVIIACIVFNFFSLSGIKTTKKTELKAYVADESRATTPALKENAESVVKMAPSLPNMRTTTGKSESAKKSSRPQTASKEKVQAATPQDVKQTREILKILHEAISAEQQYPEVAADLNQTGTVKIGFLLHPDGRLSNISILKSSGFDGIDGAALDAVKAISPIRTVSAYLQKTEYFSVDVVFE